MNCKFCFIRSSVGRKLLMALTGLALIGFIVAHMVGNLQIFLGPDVFNGYAAMLQGMGEFLWVARIGLLVLFFVHISTAISLWRENRSARPERYQREATVQASLASRAMAATGMMVLIFVIVHLMHFTTGTLQPQYAGYHDIQGRHDVFRMVIMGFSDSRYAVFYVLSMVLIGNHLAHGLASCLQTLGLLWTKQTYQAVEVFSRVVAGLVVLGYVSIPLSAMLGLIGVPNGGVY